MVRGLADIKHGCLQFLGREAFWSQVRAMEGQRVLVTVDLARPTRSNQQNRYYFGVVIPAIGQYLSRGRDLPLSPEQVHYVLKSAFLGIEETPIGPVPKRSRDLSTEAFSAYCDAIVAHAASEWGLEIPHPEGA